MEGVTICDAMSTGQLAASAGCLVLVSRSKARNIVLFLSHHRHNIPQVSPCASTRAPASWKPRQVCLSRQWQKVGSVSATKRALACVGAREAVMWYNAARAGGCTLWQRGCESSTTPRCLRGQSGYIQTGVCLAQCLRNGPSQMVLLSPTWTWTTDFLVRLLQLSKLRRRPKALRGDQRGIHVPHFFLPDRLS